MRPHNLLHRLPGIVKHLQRKETQLACPLTA